MKIGCVTISDIKMNDDEFFKECMNKGDLPRDDLKKQIILKRIMQDFCGEEYMEPDVNAIIKKYFEDFALIRREFVNFGYMLKDSYTGKYTVVKRELSEDDLVKIGKLRERLKKVQ